jgi:hypothetical protein
LSGDKANCLPEGESLEKKAHWEFLGFCASAEELLEHATGLLSWISLTLYEYNNAYYTYLE